MISLFFYPSTNKKWTLWSELTMKIIHSTPEHMYGANKNAQTFWVPLKRFHWRCFFCIWFHKQRTSVSPRFWRLTRVHSLYVRAGGESEGGVVKHGKQHDRRGAGGQLGTQSAELIKEHRCPSSQRRTISPLIRIFIIIKHLLQKTRVAILTVMPTLNCKNEF